MVTTQEHDVRKIPVRMCIGCRTRRPQQLLVRCVMGPHGPVVSRTAGGRGAWLCSLECFESAGRRRAFARAWKCEVSSSMLDALRISFEGVMTNMKELLAVGTNPDMPVPMKG